MFSNQSFGGQSNYGSNAFRGGMSSTFDNYGSNNVPPIFRQKTDNNAMGSRLQPIDYTNSSLKPLQKNFYKEHAAVRRRDEQEIQEFVQEHEVTLDGPDIPRPVFEFEECHFPESVDGLLYSHYKKPTVIQSITWPVALSGRDMVGIAQTGSGKTLGVSWCFYTIVF